VIGRRKVSMDSTSRSTSSPLPPPLRQAIVGEKTKTGRSEEEERTGERIVSPSRDGVVRDRDDVLMSL
jgi:hypothetical protein